MSIGRQNIFGTDMFNSRLGGNFIFLKNITDQLQANT